MANRKSYRIHLNEDWELEDLYEFPHALSQCYAFVYCLDSALQPKDRDRIGFAMREYPWRGGYSYVNIYSVLKNQIPVRDRPKIKAIQKASPGWLDLFLNIDVACQLAAAVTIFSGAATAALASYKKGYQIVQSINAARRSGEIAKMKDANAMLKLMNTTSVELAKHLGFKSLKELHQHTSDPEVSMKLLMAHYRRMKVLVDYAKKGKAKLD